MLVSGFVLLGSFMSLFLFALWIFRQSVGLVPSFLLVCLTGVFTGECFLVLDAGGRRSHGKMDSQGDPWTACVKGKLPVVFCYNLRMTLKIGSEVTEKGKGLQGSQLGLLEGVAYG